MAKITIDDTLISRPIVGVKQWDQIRTYLNAINDNTTAVFLDGDNTFTGVQTFSAPTVIDANTTITAFATGGQASATALTGEYNNVTTVASAFDSVKLLTAVAGQVQTVKNSGAAILSVFPNTGDSINALAVNLSVDIPVGGEVTFRAISDTVWETKEVLYSSAPTTQTGGLEIKASDNASNVDVTITNASHGQATTVTIPDSGLATSYVPQSTAALTVAEVDVLNVTAGAKTASKAVVLDSDSRVTGLPVTEAVVIDASAGGTGETTNLTLVPAGSILLNVLAKVTTPFDGDTTTTLEVGVAGNDDAYIDTVDFDPSGTAETTYASSVGGTNNDIKTAQWLAGATQLVATWTNTANMTAGSVTVYTTFIKV